MTFPAPFPPPETTRPSMPAAPGGPPASVVERLMDRRIVLAYGEVTDERVSGWCAQLLTLDATGRDPVRLHLNTPDGELGAVMTLMDTIGAMIVPVEAYAVGQVGGAAVGALAAAPRRYAYPNAQIRLSEPRLTLEGTAADVMSVHEQLRTMLDAVYFRLADVTGKEVDEIRDDATRTRHLTAHQAVDYGLVHAVTGSA